MGGRILPITVPMSVKTERRNKSRKRPLSLVYVELPPSNGGMMRDLSEHGFAIRAMMPLQQSEKVPFAFSLDNAARIDGEAIVVRIADNGHVAALEFAGLPAHARDQIRRWVEKFDAPLAREAPPPSPAAAQNSTLDELRQQARTVASRPPTVSGEREIPVPPPPVLPTPPPQIQQVEPPTPPTLQKPEPPAPVPLAGLPVELPHQPAPPTVEPPPALSSPRIETTHQPSVPPLTSTAVELTPESVVPPAPPTPPSQLQEKEPPAPVSLLSPPVEQTHQPTLPFALPTVPSAPPSVLPPPEEPPEPRPLLKLSSVRPSLPPEAPAGPIFSSAAPHPVTTPPPAEIPQPAATPNQVTAPPAPAQVPIRELLIPPPSIAEKFTTPPTVAPPRAPLRTLPPALEPLSSLEAETETGSPGWMENFTLGRAIGIMLFLTLVVGSYVYHRELGYGLIWLGQQLVGDESPESSGISRPSATRPTPVSPEPAPMTGSAKPPSGDSPVAASKENKSVEVPPTTENPPTGRAKDTNPNPLVSSKEANPPPASPAPAPTSSSPDTGQQEYQQASQILHAPKRKAELPEAIRLLWAAVKKGNVPAEITLAELYHKGRGVAKSCDQTRILLSAAASKGSPDAQARLRAFRQEGCKD